MRCGKHKNMDETPETPTRYRFSAIQLEVFKLVGIIIALYFVFSVSGILPHFSSFFYTPKPPAVATHIDKNTYLYIIRVPVQQEPEDKTKDKYGLLK